MTRKHPNARRAVALALFAIFLIASSAGAWFPSTASAMTTGGSTPGRSPLPGDPNTPDEGGRTGSTNRLTSTDSGTAWIVVWLKGLSHFHFILR